MTLAGGSPTISIAKKYGAVRMEDLNIRAMTTSGRGKRGLNRVMQDASLAEFRRMLVYKGLLYGCEVTFVNPAYTSQRCSACGHTETENRLSQALFVCRSCGHRSNADLNAALNIFVAGSCPETQNARGADVSHTIGVLSAMRRESVCT